MVARVYGPFEYYQDIYAGVNGDAIRSSLDDPANHVKTISTVAGDLADDKKASMDAIEGDIAKSVGINPESARGTALKLVQNGQYALGCLRRFATDVDIFDTKVNSLNTRYNASVNSARHDPDFDSNGGDLSLSDFRKTAESGLQPEYKQALAKVESDADAVQAMLDQGATTANVKKLVMSGMIPLEAAAAYSSLNLTPEERYKAYRAGIKTGANEDFAKMTEDERQQFVKDEPGMIPFLMNLPHPTEQEIADVVALVLPHVDSVDAKADASEIKAALDGTKGPDAFLHAFERSQQISVAMATLSPWLKQHQLDVSDVPVAKDMNAYLKEFAKETWPKHDAIMDYIKSDKHTWNFGFNTSGGGFNFTSDEAPGFTDAQKSGLMTSFANDFLHLSNEDIAGGWNDLPKSFRDDADQLPDASVLISTGPYSASSTPMMDQNNDFKDLARFLVHGDAMGGDDLSKHIASTAMASTSMWDQYKGQVAGGSKFDNWDDSLTGDVMGLVSRNHEATADLLSGKNVPPNYLGNYQHEISDDNKGMPSIYVTDFNSTLFGHNWDDSSETKVASMIDWLHDAHKGGDVRPPLVISPGDAADAALADRAFNGMAKSLTSTESGAFRDLMGDQSNTAAQHNPLLAKEMVNATADHLKEFAVQAGKDGSGELNESQRVRLMTLLASEDKAADRLSAAVTAYQRDAINSWVDDPQAVAHVEDLADRNSRLSTYLDASLINAAYENGLDKTQAEQARVDHIKNGIAIVSTLAGLGPTGSGTIAGLGRIALDDLIEADYIPTPSAALSPDWTAQGSHVTTSNAYAILGALEASGKVDASDIPADLRNPGASDAEISDATRTLLDKLYPGKGIWTAYKNEVQESYDADLNNISVKGKDEKQVEDFLKSPHWPN